MPMFHSFHIPLINRGDNERRLSWFYDLMIIFAFVMALKKWGGVISIQMATSYEVQEGLEVINIWSLNILNNCPSATDVLN